MEEEITAGKVKELDITKYLEMTINTSGNLKDHIRQLKLIAFAKRLMSTDQKTRKD